MKKDTSIWFSIMALLTGLVFGYEVREKGYFAPNKNENTYMLISGKDTFVVNGDFSIEKRFAKDHWVRGHWDSATRTTYMEFEYISIPIEPVILPPAPLEGISIGTHKGDVITNGAVKNVYNTQK